MRSTNFKANRILAALIDGLVMFILLALICVAPTINLVRTVQANNYSNGDIMWLVFSLIGSVLVWVLYLSLTGLIFKNATLGMKIMRLVFVRSNGSELTFINIFTRELISVICIIFSLVFSLILDSLSLICS